MAPFASCLAMLHCCVIANAQAAAVQRQGLLSGNTAQRLSFDLCLEEHLSWTRQASKLLLFLLLGQARHSSRRQGQQKDIKHS